MRPSDPGIGTVRRLYFYFVSLVALMMAVNGLVQIVRFPLDSLFGPETLTPSRTALAVGISLAVVGLPLWAFHWRTMQRYVARAARRDGISAAKDVHIRRARDIGWTGRRGGREPAGVGLRNGRVQRVLVGGPGGVDRRLGPALAVGERRGAAQRPKPWACGDCICISPRRRVS